MLKKCWLTCAENQTQLHGSVYHKILWLGPNKHKHLPAKEKLRLAEIGYKQRFHRLHIISNGRLPHSFFALQKNCLSSILLSSFMKQVTLHKIKTLYILMYIQNLQSIFCLSITLSQTFTFSCCLSYFNCISFFSVYW